MSKWEAERRKEIAVARAPHQGIAAIFPSAVLSRALGRPFVPPTPRLAIDSYWRAHPLRADRLARALAARSGAPSGWTWRLGDNRKDRLASHIPNATSALSRTQHTRRVQDFAVYAGNRFIASAGMSTCGTPVPTRMRPGTAPAWSHGNSGTRRAAKPGSCGACRRGAAAKPAGGCGRPPRLTTASRCFGCGANTATRRGRSCSIIGACQIFR